LEADMIGSGEADIVEQMCGSIGLSCEIAS
jgi:hypothetical protein